MDHLDEDYGAECGEDGRNRKAALEDRKRRLQQAEKLGRGHNARMQPQCQRTEKSLPDASDIRFGKTALRMVFPEEKRHKKGNKKCVSSSVSLLWTATNRGRHIQEATG